MKSQHPKFYSHPHYWINAIEVEREHTDIVEKLTLNFLTETIKNDDLWKYKPLFKPQQGEQFLKDLEQAVSAGLKDFMHSFRHIEHMTFVELIGGADITIYHDDIQDVCFSTDSGNMVGFHFDTAAYVDKLRELGYYI